MIALVVGVPSAIDLLRVRAASVTLTVSAIAGIRSVGHRTEGKSGSTPVVAKYGCDSVRPKELFAKYGRPPLGNNIPPFADTMNVTAVLIYPLSAGWSP